MDSDFEVFFDDDDEEMVMFIERPYVVRIRPSHFNIWSEKEFFDRFRISKAVANEILVQITHDLEHRTTK